jgi:hypothetical protein
VIAPISALASETTSEANAAFFRGRQPQVHVRLPQHAYMPEIKHKAVTAAAAEAEAGADAGEAR